MTDELKTQNGPAHPGLDLQDFGPVFMRGGGGNQGFNSLGQPYATNAIGSGAIVDAKDTNRVRRGASFEKMTTRIPDRSDDRTQARR